MRRIVVAFGMLFAALQLEAREVFNDLIFFGDDYTDLGNVPGTPFTGTGENWASVLGSDFHFSIDNSLDEGSDYAYAYSLSGPPVGSGYSPTYPFLTTQVANLFSASAYRKKDPVFIWSGTNDLVMQLTVPYLPSNTAQNIATAVQTIQGDHFPTVLVVNQFDLGATPGAGTYPLASATTLSQQVVQQNQYLYGDLDALSKPVFVIDLYSLFNDILNDPGLYGFTNVTDFSLTPFGTPGYLFLQEINGAQPFSMAFHDIFADYVYAIFAGVQTIGHINEQALSLLRSQSVNCYQQLYPQRTPLCLGRPYPFVSGTYAPQMQPLMTGSVGKATSSYAGSFAIGIIDRVHPEVTLGGSAAVQLSRFGMRQRNVQSSFDQNDIIGSIFLEYEPHQYGYAILLGQYAWLHIHRFKRNFTTGPALQTAHGHTTGKAYDIAARGGYFCYNTFPFMTGPIFSFDLAHSFINSLQERGARVENLLYKKNSLTNFTTGFGWEFRLHFPVTWMCLIGDIRIEADYQWLSNQRKIPAQETSIGGPLGAFYIAGASSWYGAIDGNLSANFHRGQSINVGFQLNYGENYIRESVITAGVAF